MQISDNKSKNSVSSLADSVESGEILSSSSEWKIGSNKLFVTCLNNKSEHIKGKSIKHYLDLFITTSVNHISIRSRLVSQPKHKSISNSEQLFNVMDLSPITFGVNLPPNPCGKNSTNSQINLGTLDKNNNSKVPKIAVLVHQIYVKTCYTNITELLQIKWINGQLWQVPLILFL